LTARDGAPASELLDPLIETWKRERPWLRCHNVGFGATEFNPGVGRGRFHPFTSSDGNPVPSLYGASTFEGALSETVFHNVWERGPKSLVRRSSLLPMVVSTLVSKRDLVLAQLHGFGLHRLGIDRTRLIDAGPRHYPGTVLWAQALHRCGAHVDGLVWVSRLHDTAHAIVLFGDRVQRNELLVAEPPLALYRGSGLERVERAAELAGIAILD